MLWVFKWPLCLQTHHKPEFFFFYNEFHETFRAGNTSEMAVNTALASHTLSHRQDLYSTHARLVETVWSPARGNVCEPLGTSHTHTHTCAHTHTHTQTYTPWAVSPLHPHSVFPSPNPPLSFWWKVKIGSLSAILYKFYYSPVITFAICICFRGWAGDKRNPR